MKVAIIDPSLHRVAGHHFSAMRRFANVCADVGCSVEVYASLRMQECGYPVTSTFRASAYSRKTGSSHEFSYLVKMTETDLGKQMQDLPGLLILPTCDEVLAQALSRIIRRSGARPNVLAWVVLPLDLGGCDPRSREKKIAEAYTNLSLVSNLTLFCETQLMRNLMERLSGQSFDIRALPGNLGEPRRKGGPRPVITMVGHMNAGKGYELLPEAMEGIDAQFIVHAAGADQQFADQVGGITRDLTIDEYNAILDRTDLILLPYDPSIYSHRGSGVCNEAVARGIPIVVTQGCSFAEPAIAAGSAVIMRAHSSIELKRAIVNALDRLPDLTKKAETSKPSDDLCALIYTNLQPEIWNIRIQRHFFGLLEGFILSLYSKFRSIF